MSTLDDWGIDMTRLIAGFSGGVVHAFAFKQTSPLSQVGSVVAGALTANYLGALMAELLQRYVGTNVSNPASGFLVGLCAMVIAQRFAGLVGSKIEALKKNGVEKSGGDR
jgi:hypothetical protein